MKAIFTEDFHFDRRPKEGVAFAVKASPEPQNYPRDVVEAAIAAGKAYEPKPKKITETDEDG